MADTWQTWKQQALEAIASKHYKKALELLNRCCAHAEFSPNVLESSPNTPLSPNLKLELARLLANTSFVHKQLDQLTEARTAAKAVIQNTPWWHKGYIRLYECDGCTLAELARTCLTGEYFGGAVMNLETARREQLLLAEYLIAPAPAMSVEPIQAATAKLQQFEKWMKTLTAGAADNNDAIHPHVAIHQTTSGGSRSLYATKHIGKSKAIATIPLRWILTPHKARIALNDYIQPGSPAVDQWEEHSWIALLVLKELKLEGKNSEWWPYLQILPSFEPDQEGADAQPSNEVHPLFWSPTEQARLLEGSYTLSFVKRRRKLLQTEFEQMIQPHLLSPLAERITLQDFIWARTIVVTRVFQCSEWDEARKIWKQESGLVPWADMMNHDNKQNVHYAMDETAKTFCMRSACDLYAGTELKDNYGAKCNSRFFVNYGFVLPDNQANNEAVLRITIPQRHPLSMFVMNSPSLTVHAKVPMGYSHPRTRRMFTALRALCLDTDATSEDGSRVGWLCRLCSSKEPSKFLTASPPPPWLEPNPPVSDSLAESSDLFQSNLYTLPFQVEPIHVQNEQKVLQALATAALVSLQRFPSATQRIFWARKQQQQEGEEGKTKRVPMWRIEALTRSPREQNAQQMCESEIEVLHYYMDLAERVRSWCVEPLAKRSKFVRKHRHESATDNPFAYYICHVFAPLFEQSHPIS